MTERGFLYLGAPGGFVRVHDISKLHYVGPLPRRGDIADHSPDGFAWGYAGSGPAQLALALIAHATGDDNLARRFHQRFKFMVVARLPQSAPWGISSTVVRALVAFLQERVDVAAPTDNALGEGVAAVALPGTEALAAKEEPA